MISMQQKMTTIRVSNETRDRLSKHGNITDNFDEVINRILDKYEGKKN